MVVIDKQDGSEMKKMIFIVLIASSFVFAQNSLTVTSPNGGEKWQGGTQHDITWDLAGTINNVKIEVDDGSGWVQLVASTLASVKSYAWNIPNTATNTYSIRITDVDDVATLDVSDANFSVASLSLTSPLGGEHLQTGKLYPITWANSANINNVKLEYTTNNGSNWITIVASTLAANFSYNWTVPNSATTGCKIRISDVSSSVISNESGAVFTISSLLLSSPNGGEKFLQGSSQSITWSQQNVTNVKLEYSADGGTNYTSITNSTPANAGSYNWVVPNNPATNYLIKISDAAYPSIVDESNQLFIVSSLILISPVGGEIWQGATTQNITWTSTNISTVKLDYSIDGGASWTNITNNLAANLATWSWAIPDNPSNQVRVKISDYDAQTNYVQSNIFSLTPTPAVHVTSPNGNEKLQFGSTHNITWNATSTVANVKIEFSSNGGAIYNSIVANVVANLGTYSWIVPPTISQNCKIKITSTADATVTDESDNTFTLSNVTLTSPNGGEKWQVGKNYNLTWTSVNVSNVKLEYSSDNGVSWNLVSGSIVSGLQTYSWAVPSSASTNCKVRISDASNSNIKDESDAVFTIASVSLTSPNGGENWMEASNHSISWQSTNIANVKLEYTTDGINWTSIVNSTPGAAETYTWAVPTLAATTYKVRISDAADATINDVSDNNFTISKLVLLTPIGGESWKVGTSHDIAWNAGNTISNVKIEFTSDNGNNWQILVSSIVANVGTYRWIIPNSPSINCKVRISNVNSPDVQSTSPAFFAITKSLVVLTPNGGEKWEIGSIKNIRWDRDPAINNVRLEYSIDNGMIWTSINNFVDASLGTYAWTVSNRPSVNCLLRISDVDNNLNLDLSDAVFTILSTPSITITRPNGGDIFETGASENITWVSSNINNVTIEYSTNSGATWNTIKANLPSTGTYTWSVPNVKSTQCLVKISDDQNPAIYDLSDNKFVINPRITITAPNGGENLPAGSSYAITWSSSNVANVKIEYSTDNGNNWGSVVATTPAAAGTYTWTVPNAPSTNCLIKISDAIKPEVYDIGDNTFTISSKITVISPNGGENWQAGSIHEIIWNTTNVTNVALSFTTNNGSVWTTIIASTAASNGSYKWTIPTATVGTQCKIKVADATNSSIYDVSDNIFTISSLTLLKPIGAENFSVSSTQNITWRSTNISNIKLELSTNDGLDWRIITQSIPSNGLYYWEVPSNSSTQCRVRISDAANPTIYDISDNVFTISESPTITVLYPNVKDTLSIGATEIIKWKSSSVNSVKLEYSINGGTDWQQIAVTVPSNGTYSWIVPNTSSSLCKIKVSDTSRPGVFDVSDSLFTISSAPKITVTSPNGDESYQVGSMQSIKWTSTSVNNVKIEYSINNGIEWNQIEGSYPSSGIYSWSVPNTASTQCKIRVSDSSNPFVFDMSDKIFTITLLPTIKVLKPNGGEVWEVGKQQFITWSSSNVTNVKLEYSTNSGTDWQLIVASTSSNGIYTWTIPNNASNLCKVKITSVTQSSISDVSDSLFAISSAPKITITSPNGDESYQVGSIQNIKWTSTSVSNVKIEYSINNGINWNQIVATYTSSGIYSWIIPNTPSVQCKVRITDTSNPQVVDMSDKIFIITSLPLIKVLKPNGGEIWEVGKQQLITWTSSDVVNVKLEYSTNSGIDWQLIVASTPNKDTYTWTVPNVPSNLCRIKVSDISQPGVFDISDSLFAISSAPKITITSPNGDESFQVGSVQSIKWSSIRVSNVKMEYSINNGIDWYLIEGSYQSSGIYSWTVPNTASSQCKVRITDTSNPLIVDMSDKIFTISLLPTIKILKPNGGEIWEIGKQQVITWSSSDVNSVKLEYSINNGTNWNLIISPTSSTGSYTWTIPNTPSYQCRIKVSDISKSNIFDLSDSVFTISSAPKLSLTSPNGGEAFRTGTDQIILWTSSNVENVKLEFSINNGVSWKSIVDAIPSTGSFRWTVPFTPSNQCRFRVSDAGNPAVSDISDNTFIIATLTLLTPTDGEQLLTGAPYNIKWQSDGIANIKIEFSTNNGGVWTSIISSVKASYGTLAWVVPQNASRQCIVRITDVINKDIFDQNDSSFSVQQIIVTSPQDNVMWKVGTTHAITWKSYNVASVKLEYSTSSGNDWKTIAATVSASLGSYTWTVPNSPSEYCIVKVTDGSNANVYGTSYNRFIIDLVTDVKDDLKLIPSEYQLMQNYPNPFNPTTKIEYKIPVTSNVSLKVYDLIGNEIAELVNDERNPGTYSVTFDGHSLASGIYIYCLRTNNIILTKKFILMK
jgi:hypothetical protein